jgi:hypothetical protein
MDGMPRPRPPHLHRQVTRHGKTVWYVRVGKGQRTRIRAAFGTPEFDGEYRAAVAARPRLSSGSAPADTLAWLIERYRETPAWLDLSLSTRQQREAILAHIIGCGDARCKCGSDCRGAGSDLWLVRWSNGFALHARSRSATARSSSDAQARER